MNNATGPKPHLAADLAERVALFEPIKMISRQITVPHFRAGGAVDNKLAGSGDFDPVTEADRACETAIRALIEKHFPDDGIFGEEHGNVRLDAPFIWVIDPIDGTRAFVSGVPLWGTLVGITYQGRPAAGLGYQPYIDEAFSSNGQASVWAKAEQTKSLRTRSSNTLTNATLFTTTPALFSTQERPAYDALENAVRSVRYGTDWYGYALLAAGTVDVVVESGLSAYDICALIPIIEAAGGCVMDWHGNALTNITNAFNGQVVALGDASLADDVLGYLQPAAR
jgi:histidinol phosphatase-like enzyme (inositol monophosphatase family)